MSVGKGPRGPGLCACGGCRRTREQVALLVDKVEGKRARDGLLVDMRPGEEGRGGGALFFGKREEVQLWRSWPACATLRRGGERPEGAGLLAHRAARRAA